MELYHFSDWLHCGSLFVSVRRSGGSSKGYSTQPSLAGSAGSACAWSGDVNDLLWKCLTDAFPQGEVYQSTEVQKKRHVVTRQYQRYLGVVGCWILLGVLGPPVKSNWLPDVSEKTCPGEASMGHRSVYHGCH
jgi:hypothetical protein